MKFNIKWKDLIWCVPGFLASERTISLKLYKIWGWHMLFCKIMKKWIWTKQTHVNTNSICRPQLHVVQFEWDCPWNWRPLLCIFACLWWSAPDKFPRRWSFQTPDPDDMLSDFFSDAFLIFVLCLGFSCFYFSFSEFSSFFLSWFSSSNCLVFSSYSFAYDIRPKYQKIRNSFFKRLLKLM